MVLQNNKSKEKHEIVTAFADLSNYALISSYYSIAGGLAFRDRKKTSAYKK